MHIESARHNQVAKALGAPMKSHSDRQSMNWKNVITAATFLAAGLAAATSVIAAPALRPALDQGKTHLRSATFDAQPFPYGYAYAPGQCLHWVWVYTDRGWRWRQVWICR
jgi:hypothetical protein